MNNFCYDPYEIILPISNEEAKSIYDSKLDMNCPGPNRINELKIWWKPIGKYNAFDCFCQKCYWNNKLTSPSGEHYTPEMLEACYIKGLLCNCDGGDRKDYFAYDLGNKMKMTISSISNKGFAKNINDQIKLIDVDFIDSIKEFEGKNVIKKIVIPNDSQRLSLVFQYDPLDLDSFTYLSHKFIDMKNIFGGKFVKQESNTNKSSHIKDNDLMKTKFNFLSNDSAKKIYLNKNKKLNNDEIIYKIENILSEYNVDFTLDDQNILYYNFRLMLIVAKDGNITSFQEYVTFDIHIVPPDSIKDIYDLLSEPKQKINKTISEIVL